jgi:hypothetical protein
MHQAWRRRSRRETTAGPVTCSFARFEQIRYTSIAAHFSSVVNNDPLAPFVDYNDDEMPVPFWEQPVDYADMASLASYEGGVFGG